MSRYTEWLHKKFIGDPKLGARYVSLARTLLGSLHDYSKGVMSNSRRVTLPDGTKIYVAFAGAINQVMIDVRKTVEELIHEFCRIFVFYTYSPIVEPVISYGTKQLDFLAYPYQSKELTSIGAFVHSCANTYTFTFSSVGSQEATALYFTHNNNILNTKIYSKGAIAATTTESVIAVGYANSTLFYLTTRFDSGTNTHIESLWAIEAGVHNRKKQYTLPAYIRDVTNVQLGISGPAYDKWRGTNGVTKVPTYKINASGTKAIRLYNNKTVLWNIVWKENEVLDLFIDGVDTNIVVSSLSASEVAMSPATVENNYTGTFIGLYPLGSQSLVGNTTSTGANTIYLDVDFEPNTDTLIYLKILSTGTSSISNFSSTLTQISDLLVEQALTFVNTYSQTANYVLEKNSEDTVLAPCLIESGVFIPNDYYQYGLCSPGLCCCYGSYSMSSSDIRDITYSSLPFYDIAAGIFFISYVSSTLTAILSGTGTGGSFSQVGDFTETGVTTTLKVYKNSTLLSQTPELPAQSVTSSVGTSFTYYLEYVRNTYGELNFPTSISHTYHSNIATWFPVSAHFVSGAVDRENGTAVASYAGPTTNTAAKNSGRILVYSSYAEVQALNTYSSVSWGNGYWYVTPREKVTIV